MPAIGAIIEQLLKVKQYRNSFGETPLDKDCSLALLNIMQEAAKDEKFNFFIEVIIRHLVATALQDIKETGGSKFYNNTFWYYQLSLKTTIWQESERSVISHLPTYNSYFFILFKKIIDVKQFSLFKDTVHHLLNNVSHNSVYKHELDSLYYELTPNHTRLLDKLNNDLDFENWRLDFLVTKELKRLEFKEDVTEVLEYIDQCRGGGGLI